MMTTNSRKTLTKKELKKGFFRTFTTSHAWHYERQQHMAFEYAMIPVINKLYDKEEDRIAAYERHMEFYNCQTTMQPFIFGITAAMEEENANNENFDTSSISAMKVSLMGPLAGIGDSLIAGTLRIIATGIAAGLCMSGSILGPILFLLIYNIPTIALRYFGIKFGYGLGNKIISKLSESTVAVTTPIAFNISDTNFSLQETLDSIFPSLLPLAVTLGLYKLNRKHVNVLVQVIGIMILAVILGALKILG